jgi:hypothetical protein
MDVPAIVVRPSDGRSVSLGGMGVVFKVSGADTGGAFAVVEHPIEPGRLVLPHTTCARTNIPTFWRGRSVRASATTRWSRDQAAYVLKPRGLMHTFWNAAQAPPGCWR